MKNSRVRPATKVRIAHMSFGGWGDYEVWAAHGFTPKPNTDPVHPSDDEEAAEASGEDEPAEPGTGGATESNAKSPTREPAWPITESPALEPLGMREPPRPRPYVRGQLPPQRARNLLPPEVMLSTTGRHRTAGPLDADIAAVCRMCQIPTSIAEVSAYLLQPLDITRALVQYGLETGLLVARANELGAAGRPPLELLHRVLDGLLRLG